MIHYFYGTLQVGIGQTLCSFEHVSCLNYNLNVLTSMLQAGYKWYHWCGCSIASRSWIITAAHCRLVSFYRECIARSCRRIQGVSRDCPNFLGTPYYLRNGKSYGFQIWPAYSEGPSEQKPIKNFGKSSRTNFD